VLAYYAFCAAFGALALFVASRLYKAIVFLLLAGVVTLMLWYLSRHTKEQAGRNTIAGGDAPEQ